VSLPRRREYADRIALWSSQRFTRRQAALALLDSIEWDRRRRHDSNGPRCLRLASWIRRVRIHVWLKTRPDPTHVIDWNLASAYATESLAHSAVPEARAKRAQKCAAKAIRRYQRALLATDARTGWDDVASILLQPDLAVLSAGALPRWAERLLTETAHQRDERVWRDVACNWLMIVEAAEMSWKARRLEVKAMAHPARTARRFFRQAVWPDLASTLSWFDADMELWRSLVNWMDQPWDVVLLRRANVAAVALTLDVLGRSTPTSATVEADGALWQSLTGQARASMVSSEKETPIVANKAFDGLSNRALVHACAAACDRWTRLRVAAAHQ
jgi:hypothetical protein